MVADDWEVVGVSAPAPSTPLAWKTSITFWVNGEQVTVHNPKPSVTLLDWLREERGVLGTHVGCGEGGCGICTVALVLPTGKTVPINSCLRRLCAVDGCHIVNTQGLGNERKGLHPLQKSIAFGDSSKNEGNGSQCGFCTPGWVMNMYALLQENPKPSRAEVEQHFDGNLCRCTGYRPILSAFGEFAEGGSCCGQSHNIANPVKMASFKSSPLHFVDEETGEEWYRPLQLADLQEAQQAASRTTKKLYYVCANTAEGVIKYLAPEGRDEFGTVFIDVSEIPDLNQVTHRSADDQVPALQVGSSVPIAQLIEALEMHADVTPAYQVYADHLKRVASVQIRAVGSWAGNVMLCRESNLGKSFTYFPSDIVLVLATAGATLSVTRQGKQMDVDVLTLMGMKGDVFVNSMVIPAPSQNSGDSIVQTYKAMQRHVFSHAIVNFGVAVVLRADRTVESARIVVGGATATVSVAEEASQCLVGAKLGEQAFKTAEAALLKFIKANPSNDPINTPAYRASLATGFLYKFFLECASQIGTLPASHKSAISPFIAADARPVSIGAVDFGMPEPTDAPFGTWQPKLDSGMQASGEARYSSDMCVGALFGQLVFSTSCNATLSELDVSAALEMPGVRDFVSAVDVPAGGTNNAIANMAATYKIFFEKGDKIPAVGMPLGMILAETWAQARAAAKKVVQRYTSPQAPVVTTEQARTLGHVVKASEPEHNWRLSKLHCPPPISRGNGQRRAGTVEAKGNFKTGAQSHFCMETNAAVIVPVDGNCFEVYNGGQWPDLCQQAIALALGIPMHQILMKNPRVGGGFGGKIIGQLPFATATAVAAYKHQQPIRLQNERSDDMQMMLDRHSIEFDYTASFDSTGTLDSLNVCGTADNGWISMMPGFGAGAAGLVDNNYHWPNFKSDGVEVLSNIPAATACRAPPSMQAALAGEVIIEHVAKVAGLDLDTVMEANFIQPSRGDQNPNKSITFGTDLFNWTVPALWSQIRRDAKYADRKRAVEAFNATNRWTKKGIAVTTSRWDANPGAAYAVGAHVSVYHDGTVLVASGGTEIGQGLNTKVAMAAAHSLGVSLEKVKVGEGNSHILPNSGTTGGSCTSENCVAAVMEACEQINDRLKPYKTGIGDEAFATAAAAATSATPGVSLMASAFNTGKWDKRSGDDLMLPPYNVYGACVSEIMIDVLTGEARLERVDILMDLGNQLNAAVDIGQVQGGFVMALGYLLTEKQQVGPDGTRLHLGSWEYKLPSAYDIPVEFNVSLLKDTPNPNGVKSSKAMAEAAMHLVASPFLAIKNAIYAARKELGHKDEWFQLDSPLSPEAIQQAISVPVDQMVVP